MADDGCTRSALLHALLQLGSISSFLFHQLFLSVVGATSFAAARYFGSSLFYSCMMESELRKGNMHSSSVSSGLGCMSTIFEGSNLRACLKSIVKWLSPLQVCLQSICMLVPHMIQHTSQAAILMWVCWKGPLQQLTYYDYWK